MRSVVSRAIQPAILNPRGSWQNKKSNKIIKGLASLLARKFISIKRFSDFKYASQYFVTAPQSR